MNKNKHFFSKHKPGAELKFLDKNHKYFKDFRTEYLIDDTQIFRFFRNPSFFHYMNENFRILPFLFDPKKIVKVWIFVLEKTNLRKFRQSFNDNLRFQMHLKEWFSFTQDDVIFTFGCNKAFRE